MTQNIDSNVLNNGHEKKNTLNVPLHFHPLHVPQKLNHGRRNTVWITQYRYPGWFFLWDVKQDLESSDARVLLWMGMIMYRMVKVNKIPSKATMWMIMAVRSPPTHVLGYAMCLLLSAQTSGLQQFNWVCSPACWLWVPWGRPLRAICASPAISKQEPPPAIMPLNRKIFHLRKRKQRHMSIYADKLQFLVYRVLGYIPCNVLGLSRTVPFHYYNHFKIGF